MRTHVKKEPAAVAPSQAKPAIVKTRCKGKTNEHQAAAASPAKAKVCSIKPAQSPTAAKSKPSKPQKHSPKIETQHAKIQEEVGKKEAPKRIRLTGQRTAGGPDAIFASPSIDSLVQCWFKQVISI